ncbi:MAG: lipid-A-disaccharide synthase [Omnitrophica bacterium RIFCSPLOWO2_01_FULL_45_10]|nr:MAG: lipid-A-disaccharide synthase [Omnitrophica bacterium RIFCSPLOWO2_01_FULL_45_10]
MSEKRILIVAGEPSGDLHASNLIKNLRSIETNLHFLGIGGSLSKSEGVEIVYDISELAVIGATDVLKKIFSIRKAYNTLLERISKTRPDLAILIDYPGFNLRLARALKKRKIPILYYISPQVWAWGRNRIKTISECVDKMLVFFRFEEELYRKSGIDVEFVGHPLLDTVKATEAKDSVLRKYNLAENALTIVLLPGSRAMEVRTLLPIMARAAEIMKERLGRVQFAIAKHPDLESKLYEGLLKNSKIDFHIVESDTYNMLGASDFALVASGTATLETAIMGTPLLITYKVNLINFILYKLVSRTRFLGLINVIAGKEIAPELLQFDATPEKIAQKAVEFLTDTNRIISMKDELKKLRSSLGTQGASLRAARAILPLIKQ